jgi:hypothetical protein
MALEGNVKDFGLSEILQLIALQKKSGMLSITGERTMVIYFREGQVISTRDRRSIADDPFRDYLLRYGYLSKDEMDRIQRIQAETYLDLADILASEKKFSENELRIMFAEQIQETIQEILSWPRSQYKFIIGSQVLQGVRSFGSLKVEGLLMESMRRIDEFPELLRIFPSEDTTVKRLPASDDHTPLDELEKPVYDLLANEMRVGSIVSTAKMARFCTYEVLKSLLEKGLLQITDTGKPAAVEAAEPAEREREPRARKRIPIAAVAGSLAVCFALGEFALPFLLAPGWSFLRHGAPRPVTEESRAHVTPDLERLDYRLLESAVAEALEEHLALKGAYPSSLETLVSNGLLTRKIVEEAHQRGLQYRATRGAKSYSLERSLP